jgi:hypothetical protein
MQRREAFTVLGLGTGLGVVALLIGCDADAGPADPPVVDAGNDPPRDVTPDACVGATVLMHDTNAQALYLDGTYGPLTGVIRVSHVVANQPLTLEFWHGHGGVQHRFTLEPEHFARLRAGEKITVGTTTVDGHAHTLFIDPKSEQYRVPGAPDVQVQLPC